MRYNVTNVPDPYIVFSLASGSLHASDFNQNSLFDPLLIYGVQVHYPSVWIATRLWIVKGDGIDQTKSGLAKFSCEGG